MSILFLTFFNIFNFLLNFSVFSNDSILSNLLINKSFTYSLFSYFFSYIGMQIVTVTLIVVGLCMFTGFSIGEFIKNRIVFVKAEREKNKENKQNKEDKEKSSDIEESPLGAKGKPIINNCNELPEEPDKQIIKNIDELKKTSVTENENKALK